MTAPPRLDDVLTLHEAARFVKAKNAEQFRREVKAGIWPGPIVSSRPPRWSARALREMVERRAGLAPLSQDGEEEKALDALRRRHA